jgi:protein TonB
MTYNDKQSLSRRRLSAIVGVTAIHAALGYALVTGLSFSKMIEVIENPQGIFVPQVTITPPPPSPTPEPSQAVEYIAPRPQAPTPPIPLSPVPAAQYDPVDFDSIASQVPRAFPEPGPTITPTPPAPSPSASFSPKAAQPSNDSTRWITTDDYPAGALRRSAEGTASYRLSIASSGRVSACEITASAGDGQLDDATCRFITRRARFEPAMDGSGARVVGTYTGTVRWQIPQ